MVQDFTARAVHVDDAGAALRGVAADMGAGEPQVLAQVLHQQGARVDVGGDGFAVHRHDTAGMVFLLENRPNVLFFASSGDAGGRFGVEIGRFCTELLHAILEPE